MKNLIHWAIEQLRGNRNSWEDTIVCIHTQCKVLDCRRGFMPARSIYKMLLTVKAGSQRLLAIIPFLWPDWKYSNRFLTVRLQLIFSYSVVQRAKNRWTAMMVKFCDWFFPNNMFYTANVICSDGCWHLSSRSTVADSSHNTGCGNEMHTYMFDHTSSQCQIIPFTHCLLTKMDFLWLLGYKNHTSWKVGSQNQIRRSQVKWIMIFMIDEWAIIY